MIDEEGIHNDIFSSDEAHLAVKAFQHVSDGFIITDHQANILSVNPAFTKVTGYELAEVLGKKPNILSSKIHGKSFYQQMWDTIVDHGYWNGEIWNRRKNGEIYCEQLTINSVLDQDGKVTNYIAVFTDITEKEMIKKDVMLTGKIQRSMLPDPIETEKLKIQTIFQPKRYVSGDFYDYVWDEQQNVLTGYVMDFMGHGLSTALQTSAIRVLFHEVNQLVNSLSEKVAYLNERSLKYFAEGTFVAAIFFQIDCTTKTLTYCSAGINSFLVQTKSSVELVKVEGTFIGIFEKAAYEEHVISINKDDYFLFLSDGLLDYLPEPFVAEKRNFSEMVAELQRLSSATDCQDDVSAVCVLTK